MDQIQLSIKELNAFLKGRYMGIHQLENLIQNASDPAIKQEMQNLQKTHKNQAMRIAERIQDLGGKPVDGTGIGGTFQEMMSKIKGFPEDSEGMIELAKKAEDFYGIEVSEEIVKGDLDPESQMLIKQILDEDRMAVERLRKLLNK